MYKPVIPFLWTSVQPDGLRSELLYLHTNGTHVRCGDGRYVGRVRQGTPNIPFLGEYRTESFVGRITDQDLVMRIPRYLDEYFGVRYTNRSAFAHYLTTGNFVECQDAYDSLVAEQGMRPYEMVSRVDVGDMVCIMYANDSVARSRRNELMNRYRRAKKRWRETDGFAGTREMRILPRSFSASEIHELFADRWLYEYHFMVCVARYCGQPVWLSQCGYVEPGGNEVDFALTTGSRDPYFVDTPVLAFLKKRRKK